MREGDDLQPAGDAGREGDLGGLDRATHRGGEEELHLGSRVLSGGKVSYYSAVLWGTVKYILVSEESGTSLSALLFALVGEVRVTD